MVCGKIQDESQNLPTNSPLKGTSTIGSRGGVPPKISLKDSNVLKVEPREGDQELVTELKFRAQLNHLGLNEKSYVLQILERMRATKIQDLKHLRFKEKTRDQTGLEFTQVMIVPYETPNVKFVMEDSDTKDRIWVRCASREELARKYSIEFVRTGEAVQTDWNTWSL